MSTRLTAPSGPDRQASQIAQLARLNQTVPFIPQQYEAPVLVDNAELKTQQQARSLEDRMLRLLEVLPAGVIVLNGHGLIQQCNTAAISLLNEPLQGQLWADVIERAFAVQQANSADISLKNGRLVHISTQPLEDEPGQIVLLDDVTATRQLQVKVAHLQRLSAMGEMAAKLAHQIRTPLSSALLYLSPLLKKGVSADVQQRFSRKLHTSLSHMEKLVQDLLIFARGDMVEARPISIADLLQQLQQQFQEKKEQHDIRLLFENSVDQQCHIYGSHDVLLSGLTNLLNNAFLACDERGEVKVEVKYGADDYIDIAVIDDGEGIAKANMEKVFIPFFSTRSSGTGLGLAVVQSIVTAHKGQLSIDSEQGKGCTVTVRLPTYSKAKKQTDKVINDGNNHE